MFLIFLSGCNQEDPYDKGYEAACDGGKPSFFASQEEKDGYEDGCGDYSMYDDGYDDAIEHRKPEYLDDEFYMDGYKDGKKDRLY